MTFTALKFLIRWLPITPELPHSSLSHLLTTTIISLQTLLSPMKHILKFVALKVISGLLWMRFPVPFQAIKFPTIVVSVLAYSLCGWLSKVLKTNCLKTLNLLLTVTVLIFQLLNSSLSKKVMLLNLILLRLSVLPMMTLYLPSSDLLSSLSKDLTALSKPLIV